MITLTLKSGREVSLQCFSFSYTYDGFLAGIPHKERNQRIITRSKYPAEWGSFKALKIAPKRKEILTSLKPICYCALLQSDSFNSSAEEYDGSILPVIWFGDEPINKTIEDLLNSDLKHIDWEKHAHNFCY
jgi:hypothetical protein